MEQFAYYVNVKQRPEDWQGTWSGDYIHVVSKNSGWECPKCGRGNSPTLQTCPCWLDEQWRVSVPGTADPHIHDPFGYVSPPCTTTVSPDIGYTSPVIT